MTDTQDRAVDQGEQSPLLRAVIALTDAIRELTKVTSVTARREQRSWEEDDDELRYLAIALYECDFTRFGFHSYDWGGTGFCAADLLTSRKYPDGTPWIGSTVRQALSAALGCVEPTVEMVEGYLATHCDRKIDGVSIRHLSVGQGRRVVDTLKIAGPHTMEGRRAERRVYRIVPVRTHVGIAQNSTGIPVMSPERSGVSEEKPRQNVT